MGRQGKKARFADAARKARRLGPYTRHVARSIGIVPAALTRRMPGRSWAADGMLRRVREVQAYRDACQPVWSAILEEWQRGVALLPGTVQPFDVNQTFFVGPAPSGLPKTAWIDPVRP